MENQILRCQYCEEPLVLKNDKCAKCGAPVHVFDDADFSGDEEIPEQSGSESSPDKSAPLIVLYYILLLGVPAIFISLQLLRPAIKKGAAIQDLLLPHLFSFLVLTGAFMLAGRWIKGELTETDNSSAPGNFMRWNALVSCVLAALILAGLDYYLGLK